MRRRVLRALKKDTESFIIVVDTSKTGSSSSTQFTIPTTGTGYNYSVRTSDGQVLTSLTGSTTITFPSSGIYEIKIHGSFPRIFFNNTGDRLKLIDIKQWGTIQWGGNLSNSFFGCANMTMSATDSPDLSNTTILGGFFRNCELFNTNINHWNVSNVTSMGSMFQNATAFNQNLNNWNVSNVTNMASMFQGASSFNGNITSWNTGGITSTINMFYGATAFNQNIGGWNVSNVTNMTNMFWSATAFNQNLNSWDVSKVTSMEQMFRGASSFNGNITSWNTGLVTNMSNMFLNAISFNQNLNSWDVSNVTNMVSMLQNATAFNQDISDWNVSSLVMADGFMNSKTSSNYNSSYLDNIYNKWSLLTLKPSVTINFGSIKYTSAGSAGKAILTGSPNNWNITDGGI